MNELYEIELTDVDGGCITLTAYSRSDIGKIRTDIDAGRLIQITGPGIEPEQYVSGRQVANMTVTRHARQG